MAFLGWIDAPAPLRVVEFWQDVQPDRLSPRQPALLNEQHRALLEVMFPQFSDRIGAAWATIQGATGDPWEQSARFFRWAEATLGEDAKRIYDELRGGGEFEISWSLKQTLDARLKDADYRQVEAPVSCWWATHSKTPRDRQVIESSMREVVGRSLLPATLIETNHEEIVTAPEFIRSFTAALAARRSLRAATTPSVAVVSSARSNPATGQ